MKIWCQSCGAFGKDPVWNDYEQSLKRHGKRVTRPDTVVDLYGLDGTVPGIDSYHASQAMCMCQSVRNAIRAQREGYDVFVMISTIDAGACEVREVVDIPVVMMLENCVHFAMMLAPRFAFFTHNQPLLDGLTELTERYGLGARMVPGAALGLSYSIWPDMFGHPERHVDKITAKAREVIARGAGVLIPSALPLGMWLIDHDLAQIDGARVLDAYGCALKMAELMVDLKKAGTERVKYGPTSPEVLSAIQKLYQP